jgi:hypothetical protein
VSDIDAAIGASGPQAADHQLVVQHMIAHHVERIAAVDPFAGEIGLRRREPGVAVANQEAADARIVHHQEALEQADARIFVLEPAHLGAVVGEKGDAGARHRGVDIEAAAPARINRAAEHEIDHGAVAVERRRPPQRKRNDVAPRRRPARLGHGHGRGAAAGFGVAQLERALTVADRLIDLAEIEMRDLERVEHGQIFAVALAERQRLGDRLGIVLGVRQRRDQRFVQARIVRVQAGEFLSERERRRPVALLIERVEQQFLGGEIVRPSDEDRAQLHDRVVVAAGAKERADRLVGLRRRRRLRRRALRVAGNIGHHRPRILAASCPRSGRRELSRRFGRISSRRRDHERSCP